MANVVMIQNGKGILSVPEERIKEFYEYLICYYKDDKKEELKDFLKRECYTEMK